MSKRPGKRKCSSDSDYDDWLEQLFTTPPKKLTLSRSKSQQQSKVLIKRICHHRLVFYFVEMQ